MRISENRKPLLIIIMGNQEERIVDHFRYARKNAYWTKEIRSLNKLYYQVCFYQRDNFDKPFELGVDVEVIQSGALLLIYGN